MWRLWTTFERFPAATLSMKLSHGISAAIAKENSLLLAERGTIAITMKRVADY